MTSALAINLDDLLRLHGVESARVEFKATWNEVIGGAVLRTICAFANDLQNLNGGYIVLGVEEKDGVAIFPPRGLPPDQIDGIQKELRGKCKRLSPEYQPVLSPEVIDGRHLLVVWAPASDLRPHQGPESLDQRSPLQYYVREGSETVAAKKGTLDQLMQQAAKVPFDDRRALSVPLEKVRESRVREFLSDVRSGLLDEPDGREILRKMFLSARVNGHEVPKNVTLLFFADEPEDWFRGARIEVAQFASDAAGAVIEERVFRGPLQEQARAAIRYLQNLSTQHLEKQRDRAEVRGWVSYPLAALEESLVNAIYHRSYDGVTEPTKVYLFPDRIEIISYPGPVPGIKPEHLRPGGRVPPVPARNRRIGELLKELRLAEARGTGIPKVIRAMRENGSAVPEFDFDEDRSYFRVTLPAHPEYVAITALRDAAHLRAIGDAGGAEQRLASTFAVAPGSGVLATALIEERGRLGDIEGAREVFDRFQAQPIRTGYGGVVSAMATVYLDARRDAEATALLDQLSSSLPAHEAIEAAILERRAGRPQRAHQLFESAREAVQADARALLEHAQTKARLAVDITRRRRATRYDRDARVRLLGEAREMLRRVLQMDAPPARHAWAWFELGRVLGWLGEPEPEIRRAFENANKLLPGEARFKAELARLSTGPHPRD
jgi:ATP-dependent DNA helicase RecG